MKLILTREVSGLGHPGDVVNVADGYGRNFLLPTNKAIAWSLGAEKQIDGIRRARAARVIRDLDHAKEIKAKLEGAAISIKVKVGAQGKLYGSVTDKDVAAAIKTAAGIDIDRHKIKLAHIKKTGNHTAKVSLHGNVVANVTVSVVAA